MIKRNYNKVQSYDKETTRLLLNRGPKKVHPDYGKTVRVVHALEDGDESNTECLGKVGILKNYEEDEYSEPNLFIYNNQAILLKNVIVEEVDD